MTPQIMMIKSRIVRYISNISPYRGKIENFDWNIYEKHKEKIKTFLNEENGEFYSWAMEKLTDKLNI